jgi:predicted nucleotidyltransferase
MQQKLSGIPPWLDAETSALVKDKIDLLVSRHPDLLAVILYGSVARHEERPLDAPDTSDVDLLVVLDTDERRAVVFQIEKLIETMGLAEMRHLDAPREVKPMFSTRTAQEWDPDFIENVRRDGIVLYQRGALPERFAA